MIKIDGDIRLSKNFMLSEFRNSKDGDAWYTDDLKKFLELIDILQKLRDKFGPMKITSGYRTPEFNAKVGGSPTSYHKQGLAVDVRFDFKGWGRRELEVLLYAYGAKNVGFYWNDYPNNKSLNRLHIDVGATRNGKDFYTFDKRA